MPYTLRSNVEEFCVVNLWQHQYSERQLSDYAHIYYPLLKQPISSDGQSKRRVEKLSVAMLLCQMLGPHTNLYHESSGRPFTNYPNVEISISHTYNIYAVSVSTIRHGIDIERWGEKAWRVREKFLSEREMALLFKLSESLGNQQKAATLMWSAKEAVYKSFSNCNVDFKSAIELKAGSHRFGLEAILPDAGQTANIKFEFYPSCVMTLCKPEVPKGTDYAHFFCE